MPNPIDRYTQIEAAIALANLEIPTSEVHGVIVGAIANHLKTGKTPNILSLIEPNSDQQAGLNQLTDTLNEVYRENSELLFEASEGYELYLPSDDMSLEERVEALAAWSRGYLLGLLYNDVFSIDQLPENGAEIARDIMQIAEATAGDGDLEQQEKDLVELHEYIKVGTQLIFEFIYTERAGQAPELQQ